MLTTRSLFNDRLFDTFWDVGEGQYATIDTDDGWSTEMDLPGVNKENLEVKLERGILSITGKRETLMKKSYSQRFRVPEGVTFNDIDCVLQDGVLSIKVKKPEEVKEKLIEVRSDIKEIESGTS